MKNYSEELRPTGYKLLQNPLFYTFPVSEIGGRFLVINTPRGADVEHLELIIEWVDALLQGSDDAMRLCEFLAIELSVPVFELEITIHLRNHVIEVDWFRAICANKSQRALLAMGELAMEQGPMACVQYCMRIRNKLSSMKVCSPLYPVLESATAFIGKCMSQHCCYDEYRAQIGEVKPDRFAEIILTELEQAEANRARDDLAAAIPEPAQNLDDAGGMRKRL